MRAEPRACVGPFCAKVSVPLPFGGCGRVSADVRLCLPEEVLSVQVSLPCGVSPSTSGYVPTGTQGQRALKPWAGAALSPRVSCLPARWQGGS